MLVSAKPTKLANIVILSYLLGYLYREDKVKIYIYI